MPQGYGADLEGFSAGQDPGPVGTVPVEHLGSTSAAEFNSTI
jgi:hypothetical protein